MDGKLSIIFGFIFIYAVLGQSHASYEWENLKTVYELSQVSPKWFAEFTPDIAKLISGKTICAGFVSEQVPNIPANAFSGFTADCFSTFNKSLFGVFSANQFHNFNAQVFQKITSDQSFYLQEDSWSKMTKEQMANVPSAVCASLPERIYNGLSIAAYSGITNTCMANIKECSNFHSDAVAAIPVDVFGSITQECIYKIQSGVFKVVSSAQIAALNSNACVALLENKFIMIDVPDTSYGGFTKECVTNWFVPGFGCSKVKTKGMEYMSSDAFAGISKACMNDLPQDALSLSNANQIAALQDDTCVTIGKRIGEMPADAYGGLSVGCVHSMYSSTGENACKYITPEGIQKIIPKSFSKIQENCVYAIPDKTIEKISKAQVVQIPVKAVTGLQSSQLSHFSDDAYSGFNGAQIAAFDKDSCSGIRTLKPFADWNNFARSCIYRIAASAWTDVTDAEIGTLDPNSCGGVTEAQFQALPFTALNGFKAGCVKQFDSTNCGGLHDLGSFNINAFSGFSRYCLYQIPPVAFKTVSSLQLKNLSSTSCQGLKSSQFKYTSVGSYDGFQAKCIENFVDSQCFGIVSLGSFDSKSMTGFSKGCIFNIPSSAFATLTKDHVALISVDAVSGITKDDFINIPANAYDGFLKEAIAGFDSTQCDGIPLLRSFDESAINGFNAKCVFQLKPTAYDGITGALLNRLSFVAFNRICDECITHIPPKAFSSITTPSFSPTACAYISGEQFRHFTVDTIGLIDSDCVYGFNAKDIFTHVSAAQLGAFTPSQCKRFRKGFFTPISASLNPNVFDSFTTDCISNFALEACEDIAGNLIENFTHKMVGFQSACVSKWPADTVKTLNQKQLNGLSNGIAGLCQSTSHMMDIILANNVNWPLYVTDEVAANLATGTCWDAMNNDFELGIIGFSELVYDSDRRNIAIFVMENKEICNFTRQQFMLMKSTDLVGLREGHASWMRGNMFNVIDKQMVSGLSSNFWLGVNDKRIQNLSIEAIMAIRDFKYMGQTAIPFLTDDQLTALDGMAEKGLLYLCSGQAKLFTVEQLDGHQFLHRVVKDTIDNVVFCPKHHYSPTPSGSSSTSGSSSSSSSSGSSSSSSSSFSGSSSSSSSSSSGSSSTSSSSSSSGSSSSAASSSSSSSSSQPSSSSSSGHQSSSSSGHHSSSSQHHSSSERDGSNTFMEAIIVVLVGAVIGMSVYIILQHRRIQRYRNVNNSLLNGHTQEHSLQEYNTIVPTVPDPQYNAPEFNPQHQINDQPNSKGYSDQFMYNQV